MRLRKRERECVEEREFVWERERENEESRAYECGLLSP